MLKSIQWMPIVTSVVLTIIFFILIYFPVGLIDWLLWKSIGDNPIVLGNVTISALFGLLLSIVAFVIAARFLTHSVASYHFLHCLIYLALMFALLALLVSLFDNRREAIQILLIDFAVIRFPVVALTCLLIKRQGMHYRRAQLLG